MKFLIEGRTQFLDEPLASSVPFNSRNLLELDKLKITEVFVSCNVIE